MSASAILTGGLGSFGSPSLLLTLGLGNFNVVQHISRGWTAKTDGNCFIQEREIAASVMQLDGNAQVCGREE